jgi:hypothetical protein
MFDLKKTTLSWWVLLKSKPINKTVQLKVVLILWEMSDLGPVDLTKMEVINGNGDKHTCLLVIGQYHKLQR